VCLADATECARVKYSQTAAVAILVALSATFARADDFKTIDGREYKDVTVSRVESDGVVLKSKSGISKVYFTELPKEIQGRFHYDAGKPAAYSANQDTVPETRRKQQEEEQRQRVEAIEKTLVRREAKR
jgi:hypothetical protein